MTLTLNGLIPIPLRDKVNASTSAIWKRNCSFSKGESVFVKAPSGTGKTTLIHILCGIRADYEGAVNWEGVLLRNAGDASLAALRKNAVSVIFQDMRLFPELTTWENLEIKRCLTNTVTTQTVEGWVERLGIQEKKQAPAATLSYGEQQRVSIIRALLQPFEWLLMDEPFSHLDHVNIQKAALLIAEVVARNKAGMLLADLDENTYFPYTQTLLL